MKLSPSLQRPALIATLTAATLFPLAPVGAQTGPNTTGGQTASYAFMQVLHAAAKGPAMDVFIDGHKVVTQLTFTRATPLIGVPAGKHHIQLAACAAGKRQNQCRAVNTIGNCTAATSSSSGCLLDSALTLRASSYSTLAILAGAGRAATPQLKLISTPLSNGNSNGAATGTGGINAGNGQATIAFANLAQGAPALDVSLNNRGMLFQNVGYASSSKATTLSPNTYTFAIYPATGGAAPAGTVLVLPNLGFIAGHTYLLYVYGNAGASGSAGGASTPSLGINSLDISPVSMIILAPAQRK